MPDESSALLAARAQGTRVEVASHRSETTQIFANPNGSLTMEQAVLPVRTRQNGEWVDIDTDLAPAGEGLAPKAVVPDVRFSSGGTAPLARIAVGDREIELRWPTPLSAPVVDGESATYADVLPGVDLRLRAHHSGFSHDIVVKTREAAVNPALEKITFALRTKGIRLEADENDNVSGIDDAGVKVFHAPSPSMWDSPTDDSPKIERLVGLEITADSVTLRPDRALLSNPKAAFPIVIDPQYSYHTPERSAWTLVRKSFPDQQNYNLAPRDQDEETKGVSRAGLGTGGYLDRSLFRFDTRPLAGSVIQSATFKVYQAWKHAHSCSETDSGVGAVQLWSTNSISSATSWNNQPTWASLMAYKRSVPKIGQSGCPPNWVGLWANGQVQNAADGGWDYVTMGLRADNETVLGSWKRFYVQNGLYPKVEITYNRRPSRPTSVVTEPALTACALCGGTPYVSGDSINLAATAADPDGGSLQAIWRINKPGASTQTQTLSSGSRFRTPLNLATIPDGTRVTWDVRGDDGHLESAIATGPSFVVDRQPPATKPGVSSALYPEDNAWHGGPSVADDFVFSPKAVDDPDPDAPAADIAGYYYGFTSPPTTFVPATSLSGTVVKNLAPPADGPVDLYVQSADRAGNRSDSRVYHFYVRSGNGAKAQWSMDGNFQDTAHLGDRHGTGVGSSGFVPGALGSAVQLTGDGGHVEAPNTLPTDVSFAVSAWARLDAGSGSATVVSQEGHTPNSVPFAGTALGYQTAAEGGHWTFSVTAANGETLTTRSTSSTTLAQTGVWTHLTGVYDRAASTVTLYVNGDRAAAPTANVMSGKTMGKVRIGQGIASGAPAGHWSGGVDEVRMYDRALTAAEVRSMVGRDNVQVGHWKFDEALDPETAASSTARNAVPGGQDIVLGTGSAFTQTGDTLGARGTLRLDHTDAGTSAPVIAPDRGFSVAVWLRPEQHAAAGEPMIAVAQDGTRYSSFLLGARSDAGAANAVWEVYGTSGDTDTRPPDAAVRGAEPVVLNAWTHVAAVYDRPSRYLRLYVNGIAVGTPLQIDLNPATGPLRLGRGMWGGQPAHFWKGGLDDLRVYSRALSSAEIQGLVTQDGLATAAFPLDGTAENSVDPALSGTAHGSPMWTSGQSSSPNPDDLAVTLDGDDYIRASAIVPDTKRTFAVTSWVKLTDKQSSQGAVASQNGDLTSAFWLGYAGSAEDRWSFVMHGSDALGPVVTRVQSTQPVQVGVWTHLTAVFDAPAGEMRLYVNGVLDGTKPMTPAWTATGDFAIGRAKAANQWVHHLSGSLDDVKVFTRTLFEDEVRRMAGKDLTLGHHWALDEAPGTTFAADSAGGRTATPSGAGFGPGRVGNGVSLDGLDDAVSTTGSDVRTDASFTVAAWVYLDSANGKATAVSIDGARRSKFRLGLEVDDLDNWEGNWIFEMPEGDTDGAPITEAAVALRTEDLGTWNHLVGVYDAPSKQLWIYVNGTRISDGALNTPWHAGGGLQIGRGKEQGVATHHWPGKVDDVRLYSGVLDKARVSELYGSFPAHVGPVEQPIPDKAHWKLDETSGTTAVDASGHGQDLTKTATGTTHIGGRIGNAAWFDGSSGHAQTAGPVLDTSASFTVSAWAYLNTSNGNRAVIAQDGDRVSAFSLYYDADLGKWAVVAPVADRDVLDPSDRVLIHAPTPASISDWTHLTVSYNVETRQLRLYLNGHLAATSAYDVSIFNGTGPMTIGRDKRNGSAANFMSRGVDDVQVFSRALNEPEVVKVFAAAPAPSMAFWRFDDDTANDALQLDNDATPTSGATFGPGISGRALVLDGATGSATSRRRGITMRESFAVSGWAKLTEKGSVQTVVGQDGTRMSGFALKYLPSTDSWAFGAATADTDGASAGYATGQESAVLNRWTHLAGVYDYAVRQLRLYVDGELVGTRSNVTLWAAAGGVSIGRGKVNGAPAEHFDGSVDEVHVGLGVPSDETLRRRATWPMPRAGQLGEFTNGTDRMTASTDEPPPAGYRAVSVAGRYAPAGAANTATLYTCRNGGDTFASLDAACGGASVVDEAGKVFTVQPSSPVTVALHACVQGADRFESTDADCAGGTSQSTLGFVIAYASIVRYHHAEGRDHWSAAGGADVGYRYQASHGWVPLTAEPGTGPLISCRSGVDQFLSTDPACGGAAVLSRVGYIWATQPEGVSTRAVYLCRLAGNNERFTSIYDTCEGQTVDSLLGYILTHAPTSSPVFP